MSKPPAPYRGAEGLSTSPTIAFRIFASADRSAIDTAPRVIPSSSATWAWVSAPP